MTYKVSCHCGNVALEVEGEMTGAMSCNCSICQRKGSLMWFVPCSSVKLLTSESQVSTYQFRKHAIKHQFCAVCGVHPFGEGKGPDGSEVSVINIRCIDDIDLAAIPVQHFDGRSL